MQANDPKWYADIKENQRYQQEQLDLINALDPAASRTQLAPAVDAAHAQRVESIDKTSGIQFFPSEQSNKPSTKTIVVRAEDGVYYDQNHHPLKTDRNGNPVDAAGKPVYPQ